MSLHIAKKYNFIIMGLKLQFAIIGLSHSKPVLHVQCYYVHHATDVKAVGSGLVGPVWAGPTFGASSVCMRVSAADGAADQRATNKLGKP